MIRQAKIEDFLPTVVKNVNELQKVTLAENIELNRWWSNTENVLDDNFIDSLTANGIKRWEKLMSLVPTGSLENRRFQIKARFNEQPPFTIRTIRNLLETVCGKSGATVEISAPFTLKVRVALGSKINYASAEKMLGRVLPANIFLDMSLMYNTYGMLHKYTFGQLHTKTYNGLRNEVLA